MHRNFEASDHLRYELACLLRHDWLRQFSKMPPVVL